MRDRPETICHREMLVRQDHADFYSRALEALRRFGDELDERVSQHPEARRFLGKLKTIEG
jgi:hypothetical protein